MELKAKVVYCLSVPYGYTPPVETWTNTIARTPGNTVVHLAEDEPPLLLYDPNNPDLDSADLTWNAYHMPWAHSAIWPNEHFHWSASVYNLAGSLRKTYTGAQASPGAGSVTWDGSGLIPMMPRVKVASPGRMAG